MDSDQATTGDIGPEDVAEVEAERIAEETSAEQLKPDTELVAPSTDEPSGSGDAGSAAGARSDDGDDERRSQGSGTPSVSMGEQQQAVRPGER
jgi:hypothetical protein